MTKTKRKRDLWINDVDGRVEVYRSSYSIGSRFSLLGSAACYRVRPSSFGINDFASREAAHAFLTTRGYRKEIA